MPSSRKPPRRLQTTLNLKVAGFDPCTAHLSARDRADDQQQDDRAGDRDQPGSEVEEVVDLADVESAREEAAEQGAKDPHRGGADAPTRLGAAWDQGAGDRAGEQAENDPGDDPHRLRTLSLGSLARRGVIAQIPEHMASGAEAGT